MSKRINMMMKKMPPTVDLFVLEFAVNDYQGQDHKIHLDHKVQTRVSWLARAVTKTHPLPTLLIDGPLLPWVSKDGALRRGCGPQTPHKLSKRSGRVLGDAGGH